jgi:Trk K+ transport system NAD-binding subunit
VTTPAAPPPPGSEDASRLERLRRRRRSYPLWRLVRANVRDVFLLARQAWTALFFLALLLVGSALYVQRAYFPGDFGEALYATTLLLVFETAVPFPRDLLGRLIFFAVPLLGLFFLLQSVVDFARLVFNKDARRDGWQVSLASTFRDHVVVCGVGRVGYRVALQLLDAGYDVVAIDIDGASEFVATVLRLKVPLIVGDARDPDVLRNAGAQRARGLIAAINDDLKNIEIALAARRSYPRLPSVMRIFNRRLDRDLEESFGRNSAFSSSALAAPTFAAAAVGREIAHVLSLPEGLLGLTELSVAAESTVSGFARSLEERYRVRVIRHRDAAGRERRGGFMVKAEAGDRVLLLGAPDDLERVRDDNVAGGKLRFLERRPMHETMERFNTVIVCGLGKVGSAVVQLLLRIDPCPALVVVCLPETPHELTAHLEARGVRVVRGDARDVKVLEQAGLQRAYAVAAVVGDDLANLQIGLAARERRKDIHLVLRVFSDVLAERLDALFGINTAYSTSALAAPTLAAAAVLRQVDYAFDVDERLFAAETVAVVAGDAFAGRTVAELREGAGVLAVALRRAGHSTLVPPHDAALEPGDTLVILGDIRDLARLRAEKGR